MCGIAGGMSLGGRSIEKADVQPMADAIRHRGPDDEGFYRSPTGRAALAHRRLSIIDLKTGHQPIFNETGELAVVFNGEIYNFQSLRKELVAKGHRFATETDTEVLVHLYEEFGPDCVTRLRGMFAFAIWDERDGTFFIARDRMGKKPLYYLEAAGRFWFASEIQALYDRPGFDRELDETAIDLFMAHSCIPSPRTIFRQIRKLPPAHYLLARGHRVTVSRYWLPQAGPRLDLSFEEAEHEFVRRLEEAVRLRMISDVPLGAFLSGGVDSSIVVAMMSRLSSQPVKTFSIGFKEEDFNELPFAREVAARYRTDHHEEIIEPHAIEILPRLVRHFGEPFGDSSALPTWYLSEVTRRHVTVALSGDGGDEALAGYPWYPAIQEINRAARYVPRFMASAGHKMLGRFNLPAVFQRMDRVFELFSSDEATRYESLRTGLRGPVRQALYHPEFRARLSESRDGYIRHAYELCRANDDLTRMQMTDLMTYLPEDILVKVDRTSMTHALECRAPFLDHELIEFLLRLPPEHRLSHGIGKRLAKEAMKDGFPDGFLKREKMGFSIPLMRWFNRDLKEFAEQKVLHGVFKRRRIFDLEQVRRLFDEHRSGLRDHHATLWNLTVLAQWIEEFLDRS
ncbi:MAG: asparagine synthase (glutamine-hydrolyzing) [Nitrospirae bacterium]|nr:asparagine synthase (glutamine-hydrolyzing) [Nitrospirota bacterium]